MPTMLEKKREQLRMMELSHDRLFTDPSALSQYRAIEAEIELLKLTPAESRKRARQAEQLRIMQLEQPVFEARQKVRTAIKKLREFREKAEADNAYWIKYNVEVHEDNIKWWYPEYRRRLSAFYRGRK